MATDKLAGAVRGLDRLKADFQMRGANATTIERAKATISALEADNKRLREARDSQMDYSIDLQRIIEDLCNERDIRDPHTTARFHYDMAVRARDLSRNRRETP